MQRSITIGLIIIIFVLLLSGTTFAEDKKKSNWYIGFGLGTDIGGLKIEGDSLDDYIDKNSSGWSDTDVDYANALALELSIGRVVTERLHIGFDISMLFQEADIDYYSGTDVYYKDSVNILINNYLASATYFPMRNGFFLKGGAGLCRLAIDFDDNASNSYSGISFMLGTGYDLSVGRYLKIRAHIEFSKQFYNDSDAPDDTEFVAAYLSLYGY